jgi:predicted RNA-binding Zn ribbon-like protein
MPSLTLNRTYQVAPDNELCLEFANTLDWRIGGVESDQLAAYADLLQWSHAKAILSDADLECLSEESARHPILAESVFARAIALREAIARIFTAISRGEPAARAAKADLALLNVELRPAMQQVLLVCQDDGICLTCTDDAAPALDKMLQPIALSAAETLTSPDLERVRQCSDSEGNGCGFFFVDRSRNRSRRWCSMESCGNRAKARRHYQREKATV